MKLALLTTICLIASSAGPHRASTPTAEAILERVDNILSPSADFTMTVTVKDKEPGKPEKVTQFKMLAKGRDHTLLMTLSPESRRGRNLLYNALDLWVFMPSVRRPFKISLQERLTGEAANADLARANYSRDYSASLIGMQVMDGKQHYRLELKPRVDAAPYQRVEMWVRVDDYSPVRAEFYAVSGRLLKECLYDRFVQFFDIKRPTRLILKNSLSAGRSSTLEYSDWQQKPAPMKFFDKSYIDKTKY